MREEGEEEEKGGTFFLHQRKRVSCPTGVLKRANFLFS